MPARWVVNGIGLHNGEVNAKPGANPVTRGWHGSTIAGQLVDEPARGLRACGCGLAALGLWLSVAAVAGALLALARAILIAFAKRQLATRHRQPVLRTAGDNRPVALGPGGSAKLDRDRTLDGMALNPTSARPRHPRAVVHPAPATTGATVSLDELTGPALVRHLHL